MKIRGPVDTRAAYSRRGPVSSPHTLLAVHGDRQRQRVAEAVADLVIPPAAWKTCPWEPREPIELGLRQWLRCAGAAMADGQVIGMPSHAVDELWHGLILCTARYERFCAAAYGRLLHHHPEGDRAPEGVADRFGSANAGGGGAGAPGAGAKLRRALRGAPPWRPPGSMAEQLGRTVTAWELVAQPGEACVLWSVDREVGVPEPWNPSGEPPS